MFFVYLGLKVAMLNNNRRIADRTLLDRIYVNDNTAW